MKKPLKIALIVLCTIIACILILCLVKTLYWANRHMFISNVDSIMAYQFQNNSDCYRFEIKGTLKKWFFDVKKYDNIRLIGTEGGGETKYFNAVAQSPELDVTYKDCEFTIIFDVDKSSYNWGPDVDKYIFGERFIVVDSEGNRISDERYALFMQDFQNVEVTWKEPQIVNDSLLE